MKLFIVSALLLALALPAVAAPKADLSDFRLELKLDKVTFEVGEPIAYEVSLTNVSDKVRDITKTSLPGGLFAHQIEVSGCGGFPVRVSPRVVFASFTYADYRMKPGETPTISTLVGLMYSDSGFVFEKPGYYRIRATVRPGSRVDPSDQFYASEWIDLTVQQSKPR